MTYLGLPVFSLRSGELCPRNVCFLLFAAGALCVLLVSLSKAGEMFSGACSRRGIQNSPSTPPGLHGNAIVHLP